MAFPQIDKTYFAFIIEHRLIFSTRGAEEFYALVISDEKMMKVGRG